MVMGLWLAFGLGVLVGMATIIVLAAVMNRRSYRD
jgi:hypothetical protein